MMTSVFRSQINLDDGDHHWHIGDASSVMTLLPVREAGLRRTIVWTWTFINGPHKDRTMTQIIELWFSGNRLIDFGGVHELPAEAIRLLEDNGLNAEFARAV